MTTTTKQTVETLAQEYCEKITEANEAWLKKLRLNDDGTFDPWHLDEDGNYKTDDNPQYFTYMIGRKYLKVVAMRCKMMLSTAESTPHPQAIKRNTFTLLLIKQLAMYFYLRDGTPLLKAQG